jgi:general secretion pathway protein C
MPEISVDRFYLVHRVIVFLAMLAALAVLGLVLAYWAWLWFIVPHPEPRSRIVPEWDRNAVAARNLFGVPAPEPQTVAPSAGIEIKVLGLVAASRGWRGYAVLQLDANRIVAIQEGEDIVPGIMLVQVQPDYIVLNRNGENERLALPRASLSRPSTSAESHSLRPADS